MVLSCSTGSLMSSLGSHGKCMRLSATRANLNVSLDAVWSKLAATVWAWRQCPAHRSAHCARGLNSARFPVPCWEQDEGAEVG